MNNINLLDYRNKIAPSKSVGKQKTLRMIAIGLLFAVSAFSVMIFLLIALSPLPELTRQRKIASFNLSHSISDIVKLGLINDRADKIQQIIEKRTAYDQSLGEFQELLPVGVEIESLTIKEKKATMTLVSKSLLQLDEFIKNVSESEASKNKFSKVTLSNLAGDESDVEFKLNLSIESL